VTVHTRIPGAIATAAAVLMALSGVVTLSAAVAPTPAGAASALDGPRGSPGVIAPSATTIDFGGQRTGTIGPANALTLTNEGPGAATISAIDVAGAGAGDFGGDASACTAVTLPAGGSCSISLVFSPESIGPSSAQLEETDGTGPHVMTTLIGSGTSGYWVLSATGLVRPFGDASFYGQMQGLPLNAPMVSITASPNGDGSWMLGRDGGVFTVGNASFYGSTGSLRLNAPVVGMAATPDGGGYWLVASDGGVFAFGDAGFYGSTGSLRLNKPVVGMAVTPDGGGYWLVASDGGVFAFGDAGFYGSTGSLRLRAPVVGMAVSPSGGGYLMVASDGGIFAFGDAHYAGSAAGVALAAPIVGMAETSDGGGYWMVSADGGVINVGDAPFYGSAVGDSTSPFVGIAGTAGPALQLIPQTRNAAESGADDVNHGRPLTTIGSGGGQRRS
jgi:hypothetical protein